MWIFLEGRGRTSGVGPFFVPPVIGAVIGGLIFQVDGELIHLVGGNDCARVDAVFLCDLVLGDREGEVLVFCGKPG